MSSMNRRSRAAKRNRLRHARAMPATKKGTVTGVRQPSVPLSQDSAGNQSTPTLDDFGGRSDALGG
jgi:hypothetical protein